ncbi:MAG: glycoside hydrolase family 43 protein [Sphingobacteriaceae bacterium]
MRKKISKITFSVIIGILLVSLNDTLASSTHQTLVLNDTIKLADPTIFQEKGIYYLYGTGSENGFLVYQSSDLKNWVGPVGKKNGHALLKGDSYGTKGFWAPQVFKYRIKYYMAYTADEHIALAESDSPLGPFTQKTIRAISGSGKQIDPYVFFDESGEIYLYHVRLQAGNRIFVAKMKRDLSDIEAGTEKECLSAELPWENTANVSWSVAEGPTVLYRQGLYYLFYSANDFRNINYAVGYSISNSPLGPWKKYTNNPILSNKDTGQNGSGHGDFFSDVPGNLYYVFHTHNSNSEVSERKTAIISLSFTPEKAGDFKMDKRSFHFLLKKN